MIEDLDKKDRLLIKSLKKNARASLVSLAKDIGLSRSATHDRLTKLESNGTIKGYSVILDDHAEPTTKAIVQLIFLPGFHNQTISAKVAKLPEVLSTHCLSGDIDLIAHVACKDVGELSSLRERIAGIEGVLKTNTYVVLNSLGT